MGKMKDLAIAKCNIEVDYSALATELKDLSTKHAIAFDKAKGIKNTTIQDVLDELIPVKKLKEWFPWLPDKAFNQWNYSYFMHYDADYCLNDEERFEFLFQMCAKTNGTEEFLSNPRINLSIDTTTRDYCIPIFPLNVAAVSQIEEVVKEIQAEYEEFISPLKSYVK